MNAKQWMKTGMTALLIGSCGLPSLASAAEVKTDTLGSSCSGGCVDIWQVDCKDGDTHRIVARVRDTLSGDDSYAVTTIGYKGPKTLVGQADREISPIGTTDYSIGASLTRTGTTHGATSSLVGVNFVLNSGGGGYTMEFSCRDLQGVEVGSPKVKLLQDK